MKNVRRIFVLAMALSILMVIQAVPALARTIYGNGTGGIYIDIEASPYSDAWDPRWGKPYADTGCTWFAEARTEQLTGINCAGIIYGVDQWWNTKYAEFGFSRSSSLSRQYKSLACWSSPHIAVVEGFTSSGAIIVSEGGVSSSKVNSSHGYCRISTFDSEAALTSKNSGFLGYIILPVEAVGGNRAPYGYFDGLEVGNGCIRVTGWAKDDDTPDQSIAVHVYIGGVAGSGAPCYGFQANRYRSDVGSHAFDEIIYTNKTGNQPVYVYAIDPVPNSANPQIGAKTAVLNGDTQAPVISNVQITDVSYMGYTVTCDVSDNVALDRVAFPTWTVNNGQDDIIDNWENNPKALGTISNGKATYRVSTVDHNLEQNCEYRTYIYAWDKAGNQASVGNIAYPVLSFVLPGPSPMESGYDRALPDGDYLIASAMTTNKDEFYYIDIPGIDLPAASETNVALYGPLAATRDIPAHEVWSIQYSDGFYTIKQRGTNIALNVYNATTASGTNVLVYTANDSDAQKWAISWNGRNGYRIQSKCNSLSLDIKGGELTSGANIQMFIPHEKDNQSWVFIPYHPQQPLEDGQYKLISAASGDKAAGVTIASMPSNNSSAVPKLRTEGSSELEVFNITKLSNGYYSIELDCSAVTSGMTLPMSIPNGSFVPGGNVSVGASSLLTGKQWAITPSGVDGEYILRVRSSGLALEASGADIVQKPNSGASAQSWKVVPNAYAVTYDANGGSNAPASQTKLHGQALTISAVAPVREGYFFDGWNTSADGTGAPYSPDDLYTEEAALTLYAQWKPLTRLVLPAGLVTIGEEAFVNTGAYIIELPESCTTIGKRAFADNNVLEQLYIPASAKSISFDAFENCPKLTLYGEAGSTAIRLAQALGIPYQIIE